MTKARALAALFGIVLGGAGLLAAALELVSHGRSGPEVVVVGSKRFMESVVLAEIASEALEQRGIPVERNFFLGGTLISFSALRTGAIDLYPEYTGTGLTAILKEPPRRDPASVMAELRSEFGTKFDETWLDSLGFSDAYCLAMPRSRASALHVTTISELAAAARTTPIRAGFASEFLARADDGWPGLTKHYGLAFTSGPFAMEAGLMYRAASEGQVDVISAYTTDGRLAKLDFLVLTDDRLFFPPYEAAFVVDRKLEARAPHAVRVLRSLSGTISEDEMRSMNGEAEAHVPVASIAAGYFHRHPLSSLAP